MSQFSDEIEESDIRELLRRFGDVCTFTPHGAEESSSLTAIVRHHIENTENQRTESRREMFTVTMLRNSADAEFGGHAAPVRGDQLVRPASIDPDTRPLINTGRAHVVYPGYTVYLFERFTRTAQGKAIR